ncbi:MAG: DUF192 domain-containing protein [Pseudomonadota bacterium]
MTALFCFWSGLGVLTLEDDALAKMRTETITLVTETGRHKITAEIARSPVQKARGLMFRTALGENEGMLFPHAKPQELTMWMRNTYISLDMIFIRGDGTVHRVAEETEPFSETIIASQGKVTAVLEMIAGSVRRLKIKPGDRVIHPHFKAKR